MEFIPISAPWNALPWPQMEPINHLAPYLSDLDLNDAVESFGQLADNILSDSSIRSNTSSPPSGSSFSSCRSPTISDFSVASSPAPSDRTYYSVSSSNPFSPTGYREQQTHSRPRNKESTAGDRKRNNASAAEKYRKKLKGRQYKLDQQMERELERNAQLKRDARSKLTLYREFISLLARNTGYGDLDLADLGSKSISRILSDACQPSNELDEEIHCGLLDQLKNFQLILTKQHVPMYD